MKKVFFMALVPLLLISVFSGCGSETQAREFLGTQGDFMAMENDEITIAVDKVSDGVAHFFYTDLPGGDPVYFFIVKSPDGNLRAAANGCQVCGGSLQGFHQEGEFMVCNTCGNQYPLDKIATEKGGCNPAPINPDLEVKDGNISITLDQLKGIKQFFN